VLCLAQVILGIDQTAPHIAVPAFVRELGATGAQAQWVLDASILALAGLLLTAAKLADRFGRRRMLIVGLLLFSAASLAGSQATTVDGLIAARAGMGAAAACIVPSALSLLTALFPERGERARAVGLWSAAAVIGVAAGPAVGGWVLEDHRWGSILLINVPVCLLALVTVPLLVPESRDPARRPLDPLSTLISIAGVGALVWAIIEGPSRGWSDPVVPGAAGAGLALLALLAARQRYAARPMLDLRVLRRPRFAAAAAAVSLTWFGMAGALFLIAQYLQVVLGHSPLDSGVRLLPLAGGLIAGAVLAVALATRDGEKTGALIGLMLIAGAMAVLAGTTASSGYTHVAAVLALAGCGFAMTVHATTGTVMAGHAALGTLVSDTTRQIGGALGIAVLGSVVRTVYENAMTVSRTPGIPHTLWAHAKDNVVVATQTALELPGPTGRGMLDQAGSAFVHGMVGAAWIAAGAAIVATLVVALWLPYRAAAPGAPRVRTVPDGPSPIHPQLQTLYLAALALRRSLDDGYLPPSHTLRHLAKLVVRDADDNVWLIEPSTGRFLRQEVADPHTFRPIRRDPYAASRRLIRSAPDDRR
jgi:EmrB/QacA subfamily drug resistance transporter